MLGNVWEWSSDGNEQQKVMRGGSFLDTADGAYNHAAWVSTRMENSPASGGQNVGFRCAWSQQDAKKKKKAKAKADKKANKNSIDAEL